MEGTNYNSWTFDSGISVYECDYDNDLHLFNVYNGDRLLGKIYPNSIEDMNGCIEALNRGEDPITSSWEDGLGNGCSLDGWGEHGPAIWK